MRILLVRHAKAGDRERWEGDDTLRPLTKAGRKQADALVELLSAGSIARIVSSPYLRCVQTVEPLASARALEVEEHDALAEGARLAATLAFVDDIAPDAAVLCTHGDVVEKFVAHAAAQGCPGADPHLCSKGSTWLLETDGHDVRRAEYLPPPA